MKIKIKDEVREALGAGQPVVALESTIISHGLPYPDNIEIVRDSYGVPHIFASTDAEVAYGFGWAQAEDNFKTIQQAYLAGNGLLSKLKGLKGASADFLVQLIQSENTVNEKFHTLDSNFIKLLNGFTDGINAYAAKYPDEILESSLFPLTPKNYFVILSYNYLSLMEQLILLVVL